MNLPHYNYLAGNDFTDYVFFSVGPKGRIKKVVRFIKINDAPIIYNLGFGSENEETGKLDGNAVTNNDDRDKVLATVAATVIEFSKHYGRHYIYIEGSTPARTRLYQIEISAFLEEIRTDFDIYGLKNDALHPFEKNVNYDSFLIRRK